MAIQIPFVVWQHEPIVCANSVLYWTFDWCIDTDSGKFTDLEYAPIGLSAGMLVVLLGGQWIDQIKSRYPCFLTIYTPTIIPSPSPMTLDIAGTIYAGQICQYLT
jgi:hypothetical protein